MTVLLPGARADLIDKDGLTTQPFFTFFQDVRDALNKGQISDAEAATAIKAIALALGSPDGSVENIPPQGSSFVLNGSASIQVDGTPSSGVVNLSLRYDEQFPGNTTTYGSGPDGTRGWFPISDALEASDNVTIDVADTGISTFDLSDTGVTAGDYGTPAPSLVAFQVDAKGRLLTASQVALIAGNGISFDTDPDTGAITISVNSFVNTFRITQDGSTRVTRAGNFRVTR